MQLLDQWYEFRSHQRSTGRLFSASAFVTLAVVVHLHSVRAQQETAHNRDLKWALDWIWLMQYMVRYGCEDLHPPSSVVTSLVFVFKHGMLAEYGVESQ